MGRYSLKVFLYEVSDDHGNVAQRVVNNDDDTVNIWEFSDSAVPHSEYTDVAMGLKDWAKQMSLSCVAYVLDINITRQTVKWIKYPY